jgi:hypothetical protein
MPADSPVAQIAHVIQLSVAPVFLLTALGTLLSVLSTRLGRIVDRARVLHDRLARTPEVQRPPLREELAVLARRRNHINLAITCATSAALFVCILIASAFIGSIIQADLSRLVAGLFIAAMAAAIVALLAFLSEILLAVASVRIEAAHAEGR